MSDMSSSDYADAFGNAGADLTVFGPDSAYNLNNPLVGNAGTNPAIDYGTDAGGTLPGDGQGGAGTSTTTTKNADGTVTTVDSTGTPVDTSNSVTPGSSDWAKNILGKAATPAGIASLMALAGSLLGMNKPSASPGWKGVIDPNAYVANRAQIEQPKYEPYSGKPVMGGRQFTDVSYSKPGEATPPQMVNGVPLADFLAKKGIGSGATPITYAMGGVASLAHGGRYLNGPTDGMADKLDTTIDGTQAAKLSHGEFVIPADVVSHLGNGNSTAGADVLYRMMDRVRKARTGNPKQGKQINPEKFMPGGLASLPTYANGGAIAFAAGDVVSAPGVTSNPSGGPTLPSTNESNLSSWAGPGIADYITRGTALAQEPYQAYQGPLTAGTSPLQQQAFTAAGNLSVPASIGQAGTAAGNVASSMGNLSYNPATATNQFSAPDVYQGSNNANQYTATDPYAASNVTTGTFGTAQAQQYMNPYLQASLDPQLAEARRQAQITQMGNNAQAVKAGAFGGSRGALMNAETQRNLGTNLSNITGQGYNTAYTNATQQFNADQARQLQTQQANEQSRQFGAQQGLANAQNTAQYGLAGLNANEASRQFGANQAMTAAQQQAQYGQQAQAQNAQNAQFGSTFGLNALQGQLGAINSQANIGSMQNQAGLANLSALTSAGAAQRGIEAENVAAQKAAFEEERGAPMANILATQKLYQGLPTSTVTSSTATTPAQQVAETAGQVKNVYTTVNDLVGP